MQFCLGQAHLTGAALDSVFIFAAPVSMLPRAGASGRSKDVEHIVGALLRKALPGAQPDSPGVHLRLGSTPIKGTGELMAHPWWEGATNHSTSARTQCTPPLSNTNSYYTKNRRLQRKHALLYHATTLRRYAAIHTYAVSYANTPFFNPNTAFSDANTAYLDRPFILFQCRQQHQPPLTQTRPSQT